ncbi:MAG TPA: hypothetical protein PLP19_15955 [bacterium]|nr:hypothetical protein [bacterium]HPN44986.1 hypothetical protein [bacterium]
MKKTNLIKKPLKELFSLELWKILIPVLIATSSWLFNERSKIQWEQYKRKEESYIALIRSVRGFYISTQDAKLRLKFLDQLNICWLYAPDEVIEKGYLFLETVHKDAKKSDQEKETALGEFMLAIRKDILSRQILNKTNLKSSNFQHLKPIGQ